MFMSHYATEVCKCPIKNVNFMDRTQKWMGSVGCLGQIENIKRQSLFKDSAKTLS